MNWFDTKLFNSLLEYLFNLKAKKVQTFISVLGLQAQLYTKTVDKIYNCDIYDQNISYFYSCILAKYQKTTPKWHIIY